MVTVTWIVPLATANIVAEPLSLTITRTISSSPNFHITRFSVASSGKIEHVNIKITIPYNIYYTYHFSNNPFLLISIVQDILYKDIMSLAREYL